MLNNWIRVLRLIWSTGRGGVLGILVSTTIDALVPAAQVVLLGLTVNAVLNAADAADLLIYPLLFGLVACFGLILTTLQSYWQASLEQKVSNTFNLKLMEKSGELSLPDFENPKVYNMLQLATREATSRPYQLFSQLVATVSGGISLVTVTGIVVTWNPLVALLILLSPVLPVLVNQLFVKRLWQVERNRSEERRRGQYLLALVTNDKTYKETRLFGLVPHFINAYRQMLGRFYSVDMEIERKRGVAGILSGLLGVIVTAVAIFFAISDSLAAGDVGRLAAYISAISAVTAAAQMLIGGFGQLFEHTLFLGNLFDFLDLSPAQKQSTDSPRPALRGGEMVEPQEIVFDDVTFRYPGQEDAALLNFSATFSPGRTVALVGENGAGKSTIVKLLTRLYEPTSGRILLGGVDIQEIELDVYRDQLAVLFQDFIQYEASLRQNIGFGCLGRLEDGEGILSAARRARLMDVVEDLPHGIDTQLGKWFSEGRQLSGGEWQRVALARALFRGAPIIVLDEPTASLDVQAEEAVFEQMNAEETRATKILISHRFSTVRMADEILVISEGKLIERGTHSSLVTAGGVYAKMYAIQAKGYLDG
ncbi:ABC transporter ATP-binding protein [Arachnia propionica]|nr:ABC transporter, ATP-binding protein [Arachnia propionica F0230a]QCT38923.1 ABC transporter ATP-binding protein [Arachnia propionica]RPA18300.1 ABC transporter ATP-binding protein [Arachnia propionica]